MTLLGNDRIRLGWVKTHIGIKSNEIADTLAKEANTDGIPVSFPFPKSFLNNQLLELSLLRWQAEWNNGETGRSVYGIIPLISHWPWALPQLPQEIQSPFYRLLRMWGNRKSPTLCSEMPAYFIISSQGTKPTIQNPLVEERPIQKTLKTKYR
ncbi:hypothetical protein AVEN_207690-1 [Araneus ventricosus]|uniref:RNase H type-1 domain-containing protein n=1 Tax=Araneus ventricosus TaxID=182803 RepID=A0A4Y2XAY0_ARAVE|nr:hypothetical protein AVEN_91240-1 [Araneus ventricosus]GBO46372.1 hypothetical protein AVEN_207690-1 [Araneus ventricosus]